MLKLCSVHSITVRGWCHEILDEKNGIDREALENSGEFANDSCAVEWQLDQELDRSVGGHRSEHAERYVKKHWTAGQIRDRIAAYMNERGMIPAPPPK